MHTPTNIKRDKTMFEVIYHEITEGNNVDDDKNDRF